MHTEIAFDEADLNGFVDGRIDPSRAAALAESLASDPDAGARLDAWRRQNDSLRTMFAAVLSEPVPVRLLPVAVPTRGAPTRPAEASRPGRRTAGAVVTTSVGMALVGFVLGALASAGTDGFGLTQASGRGGAELPSGTAADGRDLATRAAEAHHTFLTDPSRPVEITSAEQPKLARWIAHRLGADARIPSLSHQGWTFLGGRIVPGRRGPAAFLAYGNGADRLGLLISREGAPGEARVDAADDAAPRLGVATWGDGDLGYALTADRGREWLTRNVGALREGVKARATEDEVPAP